MRRFEALPEGVVVVQQDLDGPQSRRDLRRGDVSTYQAFGAVGLVSSGAARDLEQVRALDFPAFTDGAICSRGYFHTVDIRVSAKVGGVVVRPGARLHGDRNGVTTIPVDIASELADIADAFVAAENLIISAALGKKPTVKDLEAARVESKAQVEAIAKQLKKR